LDPCFGVGTTYSVCKKLNRNFIGFEIENQFIEITEQRIKKVELEKEYS
jgi:DNA modification methylase